MELAAKQTVVTFVNNLPKEVNGQEVDSKRSDKTEYAEHLGAMNQRWQLLQGHVQSKVQRLETLLDCWMGYENGIESLKGWLKAKAERLETCMRVGEAGDNSSARTALHECQEIEGKLEVKQQELEKINHTVQELLSGDDHSSSVKSILEDSQPNWTILSTQLHNVKAGLQRRVEMWSTYNDVLHKTRGQLTNAEYTLEEHLTLSGSSDMVMLQVKRLQALQEETEHHDIVDELNSATAAILEQCNPVVEEVLRKQLQQITSAWNMMQQKLATRLEVARGLLTFWNAYSQQQAVLAEQLQDLEDQARELVKAPTGYERSGDEVYLRIQECQTIHVAVEKLQVQLVDLERVGDKLVKQLDAREAEHIHAETLGLVHRQAGLLKDLARQKATLQGDMEEFQQFHQTLGELEAWLCDAEKLLSHIELQKSSEPHSICSSMQQLKDQMLHLIELSTKLDKVNELGYKLPLEDVTIHQLQALNRKWTRLSNLTCEHLSKLQASLLQQQSFLEKCQSWLEFLEHTEHTLGKDIFGSEQTLHAQQRCHELFQAEMFSRQQILHSIISSGQSLLDQGEIEDRDEFDAQLALLSDQWLGVVRRAQQRKGLIDGTIKQWQHYWEVRSRLRCWLEENTIQTDSSQLQPIFSLEEAHLLLEDVKLKEKSYRRHHGTYSLALEAGKPLLLFADPPTEETLQEELMEIQQKWKAMGKLIEEWHSHLAGLLKKWESCEKGINVLTERLHSMKEKLSLALPEIHKELKIEEGRLKNVDIALESWTVDVAQLLDEKEELSKYFGIEETTFLEGRINSLLRQLEQLRNQASLRKNEVFYRLNRWSLFNMKHQDFYQWLSKMENKISNNGNLSIEEIIETLQKHIQEEINAAGVQKSQLEQLGRILIRTSDDTRASEIQYKLGKVEQRWERLQDLLKARVKKLQETLQALDQLDKNLNGLRSWLYHIEAELSRPVVFMACDAEEIRHKLEEQQNLQRDIEQHSTGVASVLALCDMLLRDCDACTTEAETNSIQQATSTLDRRWRNICTMSMERKFSMHETQRMWKKFQEDYSHFEEWLENAEQKVSHGKTSCILYSTAKEELKKFEALERKLQESLTQLELFNKQYRRMAREGRTDTMGHLRDMITKGNHRWDDLQRHVVAILRRLRHFTGKWDDFESSRESMTVWLTEMDLQITNVEHFSDCDPQSKIQQLRLLLEPEDVSYDGVDLEEIRGLQICSEQQSDSSSSMSLPAFCTTSTMAHLHHHIQGRELTSSASPSRHDLHSCSGLDTPASTSSLEWDHYDVEEEMDTEGSRERAELIEEDGASGYHSKDGLSDMEPTLENRVRQLGQALMESRLQLQRTERAVRSRTPTGPELDSTYSGYTKLLKECQRSIETVKCASEKLSGEEISGLDVGASERQSLCVIERWEILQAEALGKELRMKQTLQQQEEFESNVDSIRSWLEQIEPELEELRGLHTPTDIHEIELHISKLKELQHAVESRKPIILLVNTSNLDDGKPQDRLRQLNQRWDCAWRCIKDWRLSLQDALMQCQDFHEMSHSLLVWLENLDHKKRDVHPITSGLNHEIFQNKHRMLLEVRKELKDTEQRVTLLQDMSTQLLVNAEGQNCLEAEERVRVIGNRLKLLIKEVTQDTQTVEQFMHTTDDQRVSQHKILETYQLL
uniref:KASH domain-containing protein n=1 Tax=Eptatretus burgeri TaxID=7764 RepID=A0A8C4WWA1_EPTBU